jgi:hypothetical protein
MVTLGALDEADVTTGSEKDGQRSVIELREPGLEFGCRRTAMVDQDSELDTLQGAYKAAVEQWITAIRDEEALASVQHSVADLDAWEKAAMHEDTMRGAVRTAKAAYEDRLREVYFGF